MTIILILCLISFLAISSWLDYRLYKKIHDLMLLNKRQQAYIADLLNYNTKIIILQKLFFCIALLGNNETKKIAINKFKESFYYDSNFKINAVNLMKEFDKILKDKNYKVNIKDGKYKLHDFR